MITFAYGASCAVWVEPLARRLCEAAQAAGGEAEARTIESLARLYPEELGRVYVLPFDAPDGSTAEDVLSVVVPPAELVTPLGVQETCWDPLASQHSLLIKGVPIPETLVTDSPGDVIRFARKHEFAVLKPAVPHACPTLSVWLEDRDLFGDCGSHRYRLKLGGEGEPLLVGETLHYPGPYYLQRLVADRRRGGIDAPRVLRAFLADRQTRFWIERYRESYGRPSDFLVSPGEGVRYRFLGEVSGEAQKIVQRAASAIGIRFGAIDVVQSVGEGTYFLGAEVDGHRTIIDRSFLSVPEHRAAYDFDTAIATALVEAEE